MPRILELIQVHRPTVVVFVYKGVLDKIVRLGFGLRTKSSYGFNSAFEEHFGARVFAFPMPGTPCTSAQADAVMKELVKVCDRPATG